MEGVDPERKAWATTTEVDTALRRHPGHAAGELAINLVGGGRGVKIVELQWSCPLMMPGRVADTLVSA